MKWPSDIYRFKDKKVLIVDDNEVNLILNKIFVKSAGIAKENIFIAQSWFEAIEEAKKQLFDVIIMDIHMPGMSGIEAAKKIKGYYIDSDIPRIVANTGDLSIDVVLKDKTIFDDFIIKPSNKEEFVKKLSTMIDDPS